MKQLIMATGLALVLGACSGKKAEVAETGNPFLTEFTTPFGVPPFVNQL